MHCPNCANGVAPWRTVGGGGKRARAQARQFIGLLRSLAVKNDLVVC
jgi:hypothetical protein